MFRRALIKLSLTRKASPWAWQCVCNSFGEQDNYKGENEALRNDGQTVLFAEVPARSGARPRCSRQRERCSMRWTSADVAFRGVARASMWVPFPRGTFIWKRWCGTIVGLNAQTGIARREVDRRGMRGTAAEKLRGFPFSFRFNHQRIQMANAEAKLTSGDRSRKLALDIFLDQPIEG
jgi:hypothetical protein